MGTHTIGEGAIRRCITLTLIALSSTLLPLTAAPAAWTHGQDKAYTMIREYWPKRYQQARQVAWCESSLHKYAYNPSSGAAGVFQMTPFWYRGGNAYGWHFNPYHLRENLYYAHQLFRRSHFQWTQWACQPHNGT